MDWKQLIEGYLERAEQKVDDFTFNLRRKLNLNEPAQIVPYRSYGTSERLYIKGRVLENKLIGDATKENTLLHTLVNMYKRFESDEVPGATVKVIYHGEEYFLQTDHEGYFTGNFYPKHSIGLINQWHQVPLELANAPIPIDPNNNTYAEVLIPEADAEYGIISDVDDTIVQSGATRLLSMARHVFLHNAHTRLPFAGVAAFYRSLQRGRNGKKNNPFFYVSSSPWNLYDLLKDFLDFNGIPEGPLLLRDYGFEPGKFVAGSHMDHKYREIKQILDTYPHLNFVLIGDSGQEDPKIYQQVIKDYPHRILAVYIRDVDVEERERLAMQIADDLLEDHKVEMVIIDNAADAAAHAAENGLIYTEELPTIELEKEQDKGRADGKEAY